MKVKCCIFCLVVLFVSSTLAAGGTVFESTIDEQVAVELTVYNNNLGLIKDTRKIEAI